MSDGPAALTSMQHDRIVASLPFTLCCTLRYTLRYTLCYTLCSTCLGLTLLRPCATPLLRSLAFDSHRFFTTEPDTAVALNRLLPTPYLCNSSGVKTGDMIEEEEGKGKGGTTTCEC